MINLILVNKQAEPTEGLAYYSKRKQLSNHCINFHFESFVSVISVSNRGIFSLHNYQSFIWPSARRSCVTGYLTLGGVSINHNRSIAGPSAEISLGRD